MIAGRWHSMTVGRKLIVGAAVIVVICTLVGAALFIYTLNQVTEDDMGAIASNAAATASQIREEILKRVEGYANFLSRRSDIAIGVAGGNADVVQGVLEEEFRGLKELDPSVSMVEVMTLGGVVMGAGQDATRRGNDLSGMPLIAAALQQGKVEVGLSVQPGTRSISQDAVAPLRLGSQITGALRVGSNLDVETAEVIKAKTNAEIVFFVGGRAEAATLPADAVSELELPANLNELLRGDREGLYLEQVDVRGHSYQAGYIALRDDDGKILAVMAVLNSRERIEQAKGRFFFTYLMATVICMGLIGWFAVRFSSRMAEPLAVLSELAQRIAAGDLRHESLTVASQDEIALRVEGMKEAVERMRAAIKTIAEQSQHLNEASREQASVSQQLQSNAESASSQANLASATAGEVSQSMMTAAIAIEQMNASIQEIARNTSEAAIIAKKAVDLAEDTNTTINQLGASSSAIGEVVKLITAIAEQTNLLALNATIEAARAGDAGKGFAVVANEVKELARQTGTATQEIGEKISAIQTDARDAVKAIGEISEIINQISGVQNMVATAVEEQRATTEEIGRNVNQAADGSQAIVENISGVAKEAEQTAQNAGLTLSAANELAGLAGTLKELVGQFKY